MNAFFGIMTFAECNEELSTNSPRLSLEEIGERELDRDMLGVLVSYGTYMEKEYDDDAISFSRKLNIFVRKMYEAIKESVTREMEETYWENFSLEASKEEYNIKSFRMYVNIIEESLEDAESELNVFKAKKEKDNLRIILLSSYKERFEFEEGEKVTYNIKDMLYL